jgi:hypothetical protein
MSVRGRVAQGLSALRPRYPPDRDEILSDVLTPRQRAAFLSLPAYDQRHLIAVYRSLRADGETDSALLQAALLHDIGKAALGGRVRLLDRVILVVLQRASPRLLEWGSRLPAPRWRLGIVLARHHPRLGAEWAAELGCSPRICWLIAHHADDPPPDDPALRRLRAADRSV